ncbi:glycoside hydrolase family 3 N-terminal domain-containing protein [Streptacidiphilus jiangxiensis]|uniref:Beta-N-acetylhexosaminidase n=1 Tax=Streptacidiphilus jiangxiensis TaxID=235985 RepID=A0A1H7U6G0_STRJI|nr:glycoside hydrolase family 3 N-terminal domain-containing protein [Streptacidiphilus jiangxiensis]SEL92553.1 beta-N-acetylhexosaminidase [Streptacidiphilus jiangxiensis]
MTDRRIRTAPAAAAALAAVASVALAACGGAASTAKAGAAAPAGTPSGASATASAGSSAGASTAPHAAPSTPRTQPTKSASPTSGSQDVAACTNTSKLAGWSDRRLAMLTLAVPVDENSTSDVTSEVAAGAGGVVLFGNSAPADLGARLAALKANVPGHLGLLVMTDEEGGGIQRMANLVGNLPWPAWMGGNWSAAQIQQATTAVAQKMAAAGVNMDLAPVVDVDGTDAAPSATNPDGWRAFSGDPSVVSQDGVAYLKGMMAGGVIPVVKHFPGIGGSNYNSDLGPAHTIPWSSEQQVGMPPFAAAVAAGAPAVMVSNDTVPGVTSTPAGLSPTIINDELKGRLGFHGLVVTDALDAKAISAAGYSVPAATVQALRAGADMVMFSLGPDVPGVTSATATAITTAVADGQLSRARLIDAANAVLTARHVNLCQG